MVENFKFNKKVIYYIIIIFSGVCLLNSQSINEQGFSEKITLSLTSERDTYTWGEDIRLELIVKNISQESVLILEPSQRNDAVKLYLFDENGRIIGCGIVVDKIYYDTITLPPNGVISEDFSLACYINDTIHQWSPGGRLMAGKYRARASLSDIQSNFFEFQIIEPSKGEKQVADEIVEKLINYKDRDQAIKDGKEMLLKYPNSVFVPNIYVWLMVHLRSSENYLIRYDELIQLALEFIKKFPNSGDLISALSSYEAGLRGKLGIGKRQIATAEQWKTIENKLVELKSQYPSERVVRYINKYVKMSKQWEKQLEKEKK
jgi:hypothetical protein